ncbi:MAG TPA: protein kinase [Candidatus Ozemobacteraceae bacterium]
MKPTTSEKCISVRLFEFLFGSKNNPSHPRPSTVQGAPEQIEEWTIGGNYRILNRMGTGGTACVLRALDTSLAREVAIKILLETESTDEELTRRFLDEGRILAGLRHPNLVTVHAMGVDERLAFPFLVMELVHGSTLDDHIDEYRTYPTLLFRDMVTILETIHYCHQRHVIHLDLKPSNIMLDQHGTIRIIDFGIAVSGIKPRSDEFALGTALYMAPEQFTGSHELSPATDIYALGVILWELLTGTPPFQAASDATDSFTDLAHRHLADEPPIHDLMRLPHAAPLAGLISSMLSKHPEKRPAIQLLIAALKVELLAQGGSIRDRYHVRQTISRTPNYLTFIAFDRLFSRPVVIRMLSAEASLDPDLRDRFLDRARELANHPLPVLPAVLSIDRDPATTLPYLVEERVEGVRLNVVIPALQARPLRLFRLFRSIWQALVVCRDAGIVHGNLVPSSILVSDQETIRFVDTVPISPRSLRPV